MHWRFEFGSVQHGGKRVDDEVETLSSFPIVDACGGGGGRREIERVQALNNHATIDRLWEEG